ncbi:MAG: PQQ-binding-like beta-propeller repeat protein [Anaerolineae bacterium]|nr:PQQ-binding-like beta-propeller repeat protein [Anaerolineae bacterium]
MTDKKRIVLIIGMIGAGALLSSLLTGCCAYENRSVRGAVFPISAAGDSQAFDLLITNWEPIKESKTFYVTYAAKDGDKRKMLWEKTLEEYDYWYIPRAISDESRIYYLAGERLLALNQEDGSTAWEAPLSDLVSTSCASCIYKVRDRIVVLTTDYVLQAIDARSGETAWSVRLNNSTTAYEGFSVVDGQVVLLDYVEPGASEQAVHVFDPASGALLRTVSPTCPESEGYIGFHGQMFIDRDSTGGGRVIFLFDCPPDSYAQSWNLANGEIVWQSPLPEGADTSVDSFLFGRDTLYLDEYRGRLEVSLSTGQIKYLGEPDPDYAFMLLEEHEDILIGKARRTRGSTRHELWGLKGVAERIWSYEMEAGTLHGVDSGSGDWTYRFTPNGIAVIQVLDDPEPHISAVMLDPQNGQVMRQSEVTVETAFLEGAAWDSAYAYVTVWGDVYAIGLETMTIKVEWP